MSSADNLIYHTLADAAALIHGNRLDEAEQLLFRLREDSNPEFWYLNGLLKQKRQSWGDAMNFFNRCLELDPGHSKASAGIEICKNILNFWNPSLFNP